MKRSISKNFWILACIVAVAWSFSYWSTCSVLSTHLPSAHIFGQELIKQEPIVYKAIPQNYHYMHLQIGGSKFYMENVPSWIKVELAIDKEGNYVSHKILGSSHEYLKERLNRHISGIRFLPAYNEQGPTSSEITLQFVY